MTMQVPAPDAPNVVEAGVDTIRRGGGMSEDDRAHLTYAELRDMQAAGQGTRLRRYGIVMRGPDRHGRPGAGAVQFMPAEKFQKWIGQGYRPTVDSKDHSLMEFPEPPSPRMWLPSMVEDAIALGEPIPEGMEPPGYMGETFKIRRARSRKSTKDE